MHDGLADAVDLAEPGFGRGKHLGETAEAGEQRLGDRLNVAAGQGLKKDQFEQLVVGDRVGAGVVKAGL